MPLACRFYSERFPEKEDTVIVNVRSIADMGAYVSLLEYNNIEGMILLTELSRRRIRSVNKLIRVGRNEAVVVLRVDEDKGYIDLSKRRVTGRDLLACEERFSKAKAVNSILKYVADQLGYDSNEQLEDLYERTAWYFDKKLKKRASCYDIFKKSISDPTVFDECDLEPDVKEKLIEDIRKRLTPQAVKIRSDIEVSCFGYDGIDAVKSALLEGLSMSTEEMPIKINLIAPPQYVMTTYTLEREEGLAALHSCIAVIRKNIETVDKGNFKVLMAPKVVTEVEEREIRRRLELLELEGADLDDDDEGEDDDGLQAPKELDQQLDLEESEKKKTGGDGDGSDGESGEEGGEA